MAFSFLEEVRSCAAWQWNIARNPKSTKLNRAAMIDTTQISIETKRLVLRVQDGSAAGCGAFWIRRTAITSDRSGNNAAKQNVAARRSETGLRARGIFAKVYKNQRRVGGPLEICGTCGALKFVVFGLLLSV